MMTKSVIGLSTVFFITVIALLLSPVDSSVAYILLLLGIVWKMLVNEIRRPRMTEAQRLETLYWLKRRRY
jgi:hypothetical protein